MVELCVGPNSVVGDDVAIRIDSRRRRALQRGVVLDVDGPQPEPRAVIAPLVIVDERPVVVPDQRDAVGLGALEPVDGVVQVVPALVSVGPRCAIVGGHAVFNDVQRFRREQFVVLAERVVDAFGLRGDFGEVPECGVDRAEVRGRHAVVEVDADEVDVGFDAFLQDFALHGGDGGQECVVRGCLGLRVGLVRGIVPDFVEADDGVDVFRQVSGLCNADLDVVPEEHERLVERDPHGVIATPPVRDEVGVFLEVLGGIVAGDAAVILDPPRVYVVHHGDHRHHAMGPDFLNDVVVVRDFFLVELPGVWLDPGPLDSEPERVNAERRHVGDVFLVAVAEVCCIADGVYVGVFRVRGLAAPVAVAVVAFDLETRGGYAPVEEALFTGLPGAEECLGVRCVSGGCCAASGDESGAGECSGCEDCGSCCGEESPA